MIDPTKRVFWAVLKHARESRGFSQRALAVKVGCTQSTLSPWESGRAEVTETTLIRVADALGTTVIDMIHAWEKSTAAKYHSSEVSRKLARRWGLI